MYLPRLLSAAFCVLCCLPCCFGSTGLIKASSTDGEGTCPTSVGVSVYERSSGMSKVLGAIPDGRTVRVDVTINAGQFYWVQGEGHSGPLAGYVYKTCVVITSENDPSSPRLPVVALKPSMPAADCETAYSAGCHSFNEMVKHDDREVVSAISKNTDALVCFKSGEDAFLIVSYNNPFKNDHSVERAVGIITMTRFKNGQRDTDQYWVGSWSRAKGASPEDARFLANNGKGSIYPTSVYLTYAFQNVAGSLTTYSLKIRLSTLRFTESYDATTKKTPYHGEGEGMCYNPGAE